MTRDESELMNRFVGRAQLLVDSHAQLKLECERMQKELDEQKKLYSECKAECDRLKVQCDNLRFAKVLSVTESERDRTKKRLSNLVREIDKCISLLNE